MPWAGQGKRWGQLGQAMLRTLEGATARSWAWQGAGSLLPGYPSGSAESAGDGEHRVSRGHLVRGLRDSV